MVKKSFWQSRTVEIEVPTIGTLSMGNGNIGTLRKAQEFAKSAQTQEKARAFGTRTLSLMVLSPPMNDAEVRSLSTEAIQVLEESAADLLGLSKYLPPVEGEYVPHERLYLAQKAWWKEFSEDAKSPANTLIEDVVAKYPSTNLVDDAGSSLVSAALPILEPGYQAMQELGASLAASAFVQPYGGSERLQDLAESALGLAGISHDNSILELAQTSASIQIPEPFFSEMLISTGLNSPAIHTPAYMETFDQTTPTDPSELKIDDLQRRRLLDAFDTLTLLEDELRSFIEQRLSEIENARWWKRRVPQRVREDCEVRKHQRETPSSAKYPPLSYSYLNDLKDIILRSDNWQDVFQPVFRTEHELRTMFTWIEPVRKDVAHSRPPSPQDYQHFLVAARWLLNAARGSWSSDEHE